MQKKLKTNIFIENFKNKICIHGIFEKKKEIKSV